MSTKRMELLFLVVLFIAPTSVYARNCGEGTPDGSICDIGTIQAVLDQLSSGPGGGWLDDSGGMVEDGWERFDFCETVRIQNLTLGCEGNATERGALLWSPMAYAPGSGIYHLVTWLQSGYPVPSALNQGWAAISTYDTRISTGYGRTTADYEFLTEIKEVCAVQARAPVSWAAFSGCMDAYNALVGEAYPSPNLASGFEGVLARLTGLQPDIQAGVSAPIPWLSLGVNFSSPDNSLSAFVKLVRREEVCRKFEEELASQGCQF